MPTVTASARKKVPVTPVMTTSGRNTTIGVIVDPMSGTRISAIAVRIASISACTASATATVLLSGWRNTFRRTAGRAFAVTATYAGFTDEETVAMSPIRTGTLSGVVFTTMFEMSAAVRA